MPPSSQDGMSTAATLLCVTLIPACFSKTERVHVPFCFGKALAVLVERSKATGNLEPRLVSLQFYTPKRKQRF